MKGSRREKERRLSEFAHDIQVEANCGAWSNGRASSYALAHAWHTDKRGVRIIINELRKAGHPICSDQHGYWYAETPEEMAETVRRIRRHAIEELKAISKMSKALRKQGYTV